MWMIEVAKTNYEFQFEADFDILADLFSDYIEDELFKIESPEKLSSEFCDSIIKRAGFLFLDENGFHLTKEKTIELIQIAWQKFKYWNHIQKEGGIDSVIESLLRRDEIKTILIDGLRQQRIRGEEKIYLFTCLQCGYQWSGRLPDMRICPKCKSPYWDKPKWKNSGSPRKGGKK